jgi:hypothetical protein
MFNAAHWLKIPTFTAYGNRGMKNISGITNYSNKNVNRMGVGGYMLLLVKLFAILSIHFSSINNKYII